MAKKPRTPDPPRKVQAPKVRQSKQQRSGFELPGTNVWIGIGLFAIAGLAVALLYVLSGSKSSPSVVPGDVRKVERAMAAAGCTFTAREASAAQRHMGSADERVTYETYPPSSGVHYPVTSVWGNYRVPADPRQAVHNLEHGGVVVWYGPQISTEDRAALDAFYNDDPRGLMITPLRDSYPGVKFPKHDPLGSKIAMSVWTVGIKDEKKAMTYIAVCPSYDGQTFTAFRDAFRGKGPEPFTADALQPGGN